MRGFSLLAACVALLLSLCAADVRAGEDWASKEWSEIEEAARGTEVRFYMYGGWAHVNKWVDTYVARELKERYGITLVSVPMNAPEFVNKLLTEKAAGKESGSIDLMWINGENFKNAKEAGVLFGPYAKALPNFRAYVLEDAVAYDFGFPTEDYESPYGTAQFVFEYDSVALPDPPRSFAELKEWVVRNPGQFTYPQPPDFTGSAFIRQAFYAVTGGYEQYMSGYLQTTMDANAPKLWAYLNELKPNLWQQGKAYPKDSAALDTLFARGEVALNMSYHPAHAQGKILEGMYKGSVRTYVMEDGSLYNTHYVAIAFNSPNIPGAMVAADFLLSPEAQLDKYDPANWGDFPAIDVTILPPEMRKKFEAVDLGWATLTPAELGENPVPEIPAKYLEELELGWEEHVLN